jgi:putative transposase
MLSPLDASALPGAPDAQFGGEVPTDLRPEFKTRVAACYQVPSRAIAPDLANGIRSEYAPTPPTAVSCFQDDFESCIAHLRLPVTCG